MSVCLRVIPGPHDVVEVWVPDYDKLRLWLCDGASDNRIDLTLEQARELHALLAELL